MTYMMWTIAGPASPSQAPSQPETRFLLPQHQALLEASAISAEVAGTRGYWSALQKDDLRPLGFADYQCRVPALVIPVWNAHGEIATYQTRPDTPRLRNTKPIKYETQVGSRMVLDVPPAARPFLSNPAIPLWITEGIRKADSGASRGLAIIALLGVWNWRGTNAHGGKVALPDWECMALNGRRIYLAFDSDATSNPQVAKAVQRLGAFLGSRKAEVRYIPLGTGQERADG
jgi:hypothetical protein